MTDGSTSTSDGAAEPAIVLEHAGKRYTKYEDAPMLVTAALRLRSRTRRSALWAVRDADFSIGRGESVGVIGRNGSGKSTLLQMMAGVTAPTEGRVRVRGRVAPLVEVGVGFHLELTGRENVYVNGAILGMRKEEIDARFDEILDFAEIEDFIDTPVKFYSSGMFVRLGFAVAVHSRPSVLLVDEVLAVGDLAFQMKCFDRMMEIRDAGTTIVAVSHNLNAVRNMCERVIVLHNGTVRFDGEPNGAISLFHEILSEPRELDSRQRLDVGQVEVEHDVATIESLALLGPDGQPTAHVATDSEVTVRVEAQALAEIERPVFGFAVFSETGAVVHTSTTRFNPGDPVAAGSRVTCDIGMRLPLNSGTYSVVASLWRGSTDGFKLSRLAETAPMVFYVSSQKESGGLIDLAPTFHVRSDTVQ